MPHELLERFRKAQVIPVVRTRSAKAAATAVAWLRDAGLTYLRNHHDCARRDRFDPRPRQR